MAEQLTMPKLGFDMAEGTLVNWVKELGEQINKGDVIAEIETDKATIEIEAQAGGTLLKFLAQPGDVVEVGAPIAYVGEAGETVDDTEAAPAKTAAAEEPATESKKADAAPAPQAPASSAEKSDLPAGTKASPIARRIAEERGVDLSQIQGSGPGGRITKKDVEDFPIDEAPAAPQAAKAAAPALASKPTFGNVPSGDGINVEDVSKLRSRIGQRMVQSKQQVPHFYVTTEVDIADALNLRKQLNESVPADSKISVNDLIVKAIALTLREFPNLNSHYYGDKIVRYEHINIGIAVALPEGGLMNVVAHDADRTALGTLAKQNRDKIGRAREGKVRGEDVEGSTFSVSNLGPFDVDHFSAIINPPESGIVAVGSAKKVPVVLEDGTIGVGMRMKVTISVDHRVSDGAEAAEFLQFFKQLLESPMRLLI